MIRSTLITGGQPKTNSVRLLAQSEHFDRSPMSAVSKSFVALIAPAYLMAMAKNNSRPTFKPKPFMDGSGWHVDVEWPDGVIRHVDDFGSGSEAREWIAKKSQAWLQKLPMLNQNDRQDTQPE
jgi:hypothetical protein